MSKLARAMFPVAVHLLLRRGDELLMLRRFNTGYEDGNYGLVAGHLDGGEDVYAAMIREAREEAGIAVAREDLEVAQVMHYTGGGDEYIVYFFHCDRWRGDVYNAEPGKCDELRWVPVDQLPDNTIDYVRVAIENDRRGLKFSLYGWT